MRRALGFDEAEELSSPHLFTVYNGVLARVRADETTDWGYLSTTGRSGSGRKHGLACR